jgi:hypothetical protein
MEKGGQGGAACRDGEDRGEERELESPTMSNLTGDACREVDLRRAIPSVSVRLEWGSERESRERGSWVLMVGS